MDKLIGTLIEISLYSAALTGAILLLRALLRRSISPRLQYLLWMLLIARLLLPVTLESGFHVQSLLPKSAPVAVAAEAIAPPIAAPEAGVAAQPGVALPAAAGAPAIRPKRLDPNAIAAAIWLLGMAAFAAWMGFVKLRHLRRMRLHRMETPSTVLALYAECRAELKVKARAQLWVVDSRMSPGLALLPRATVLIPAELLTSPEKLRFALLHELTHLKRGDQLMCALLNLLRIAYWFDPFVHLAFSELQMDMETACDAEVLEAVGGHCKRAYLETILSLFSFEAQPQLGMARFTARRMAQKRMKGAFMRKKSTLASRVAVAALSAVLVICCFTTACQPAARQQAANAPHEQPQATGTATTLMENSPAPAYSSKDGVRSAHTVQLEVRASGAALKENLGRLSELINANGGITVQPDEEWSFLGAFGPLDESNGWTLSPGIIDGTFYENIGCAGMDGAATALYCALLKGNITVSEHHCHAWPAAYAELGLDATVSTGVADLKFVNNTGEELAIACALGAEEDGMLPLTIELIGAPLADGTAYELRSTIVETTAQAEREFIDDPELPEGMTEIRTIGRDGCKVDVYRDAMGPGGETTASERLYAASYRAVTERWSRGTKKPHNLSDMTRAELAALGKLFQSKYSYDSAAHSFDEINAHYAEFFRELEVDCGGVMEEGGSVSFTIGVPMSSFTLEKCYPYAAVIFALDPAVSGMSIGSLDYRGDDSEYGLSLSRADVEAHYASVLDRPLAEHAQSEKLLAEMMAVTAAYKK